MHFVFISDLLLRDGINGGGELNNHELCQILQKNGHEVLELNSHILTDSFLKSHKNSKFIFGNFLNVPRNLFSYIQDKMQYLIYEHDHKYLKNRNPALYEDFLAPQSEIVFKKFYANAQSVLCQSKMHKNILVKNLNLENIISVGGNLWSENALEYIREVSKSPKEKKYSIMDSPIPHKNTFDAVRYCRIKNIPYDLIPSCQHKEFLKKISQNDTLIFLPKTPETLSRIVVEARMLGSKIITNSLIGATSEDWFFLKGEKLISIMQDKRDIIPKIVIASFDNEDTSHS